MIGKATVGAIVALLATAGAALATGDSIKIQGPTSLKADQKYSLTITGNSVHPNGVTLWEQTPASSPCATKLAVEYKRSYAHVIEGGGKPVGKGRFHVVDHFEARVPGTHRFCAYLWKSLPTGFTLSSTETLAYAQLELTDQ
jgi:hypothetical protein